MGNVTNTTVTKTLSELVEAFSSLKELLWIGFFTTLTFFVGMIVLELLRFKLEAKRLKLLLTAKPEQLAIIYVELLRKLMDEYGGILRDEGLEAAHRQPWIVVLKKKLMDFVMRRSGFIKFWLFVILLSLLVMLYALLVG